MERNLFRYILVHSKSEQAVIFVVALLSQFFYFISLDIPKTIVNVIQGKGFPSPDATQRVLGWKWEPWGWLVSLGLPQKITIFSGFELDQLSYLWVLSLVFLVFVFINGGFKYQINTMKGKLGERMLRRLRFDLVDRVLRFPLPYLRRMGNLGRGRGRRAIWLSCSFPPWCRWPLWCRYRGQRRGYRSGSVQPGPSARPAWSSICCCSISSSTGGTAPITGCRFSGASMRCTISTAFSMSPAPSASISAR